MNDELENMSVGIGINFCDDGTGEIGTLNIWKIRVRIEDRVSYTRDLINLISRSHEKVADSVRRETGQLSSVLRQEPLDKGEPDGSEPNIWKGCDDGSTLGQQAVRVDQKSRRLLKVLQSIIEDNRVERMRRQAFRKATIAWVDDLDRGARNLRLVPRRGSEHDTGNVASERF